LNKLLPLLAFSILLLVPVGSHDAFAYDFTIVEMDDEVSEIFKASGANPEDIIFDGGDHDLPSFAGTTAFLAEDFEVTEDAFLRDVHLVVLAKEGDVTGIEYKILDDNDGEPGNTIKSGTSVNFEETVGGTNLREYWFDLEEEVKLDANTRYWIAIKSVEPGINFSWGTTSFVFGEPAKRENQPGVWIDFDPPIRFSFKLTDSQEIVGGEFLPIDSTALILAGAQTFSWMIPVALSVLGIGLFVVSRKSENS